jgi:hypothetical protein
MSDKVTIVEAADMLSISKYRVYDIPQLKDAIVHGVKGKSKSYIRRDDVIALKELCDQEEEAFGRGPLLSVRQITEQFGVTEKEGVSLMRKFGIRLMRGCLVPLEDAQANIGSVGRNLKKTIKKDTTPKVETGTAQDTRNITDAGRFLVDANGTVQRLIPDSAPSRNAEEEALIYERIHRYLQFKLTFNRVITVSLKTIMADCELDATYQRTVLETLVKFSMTKDISATIARGAIQ